MAREAPSRRGVIWRWITLIGVLVLVFVALLGYRFYRSTIPTPTTAFYTPPDPLPAGAPGTLIRYEELPDALPDGAQAYRILYTSTGLNGEPIAVSGVVTAPAGESATPRPMLAWAHGTVGVLPVCAVSQTSNPYAQTPAIQLMVDEGFVVVATDYPGLGTPGVHPYIVGPVAANAVLDSIRAARQLPVSAGDQYAVWGASQGGHSSLWTAQRAAEYAPDLTLIAAAASAPAINLAGIIGSKANDLGGGVFTGEALYAWSQLYPGANLDDIIKPEQRAQFERIAQTCISTPAAFLTIGGLMTPAEYLSVDVLSTEPWRTIIDENTPRGRVAVPLLVTHGTADTLIDFDLSVQDVARRCAEGENVQFVRLPGVGHDAREESAVIVIGWIQDRFAGRPTGSNCG
jgi:pimeloyl-ACP methyl ester carboxylesterase